jgi:hypothetical protein
MSVFPSAFLQLAILAVSLAPLQAAYIQRISFGFEIAPSYSSEVGHFILQYKPEFAEVSGQNGSIDWMTMTVGDVTRDLVRDQVVVADYFGFAFFPATRQVQIGTSSSSAVGFAPGHFIYGIGPSDWEIRQADSESFLSSTAYAPINYLNVGEAQDVPENASTGAMMLGGLCCLGLAARKWRRKTSGFRP